MGISRGVELTFDDTISPRIVLAPKERDWGDEISSSKNSSLGTRIPGTLTLPSSIAGPARRELQGTLSGTIIYPAVQGSFLYETRSLDIQVPVKLHLMPRGALLQMWGGTAYHVFAATLILIAAAGILIGAWVGRRVVLRRSRVSRGVRQTAVRRSWRKILADLWPAYWVVFAGGMLLLGLAIFVGTDGPAEVLALNVVIGVMFGLGFVGNMYALLNAGP